MIYYELIGAVKEPYISKKEVTFNPAKLEKIRKEMIKNCSIIHHHKYTTINKPNYYSSERIVNYCDTKTGFKKISGYEFEFQVEEYLVEYDELIHPYEVTLLTSILAGDSEALEQLLNIIYSKPKIVNINSAYVHNLTKAEEEAEESIAALASGTIEKSLGELKLKLIKEKIADLEEHIDRNKNQKRPQEYYQTLRESFIMSPVATLPLQEFKKVFNFFNYDENTLLADKRITKIRQKTEKTDK